MRGRRRSTGAFSTSRDQTSSEYRLGAIFSRPRHPANAAGLRGSIWCPGEFGGTNISGLPAADPESGVVFLVSCTNCGWPTVVPGIERDRLLERPIGTVITDFAVRTGTPGRRPGPPGGFPSSPSLRPCHRDRPDYGSAPQVGPERRNPALEGLDVFPTGNLNHPAMMVTPDVLQTATTARHHSSSPWTGGPGAESAGSRHPASDSSG